MNVFSNIAVKTDIDIFVKIGEKENQNRVEYGDVLRFGLYYYCAGFNLPTVSWHL
jgi:hypothetical protein